MISFKEFKTVCSAGVAGPQKGTNLKNTALPSTSLTPISQLSNASAMYNFITETYRDLQSYISGLHQDLKLIETINKYKNGCSEVYTKALESYSMCYQLAQNIVRTMDIFKELCTCLPDLEEYNYRLCEIISIFIAYELRLGADATQQEQVLIAQRIIYIMRRHLVQEEEHETSLNILRTLVYIPKLFNARGIMCAIFSEFIAIKPVPEVKVFPDKIYMLYIIVFFRWMMMQEDNDDKQLIVNFAESFMKPSVSLCSNNLYGAYLPLYSKHSTATRTILNNLKFYADIRNACVIDNAYKNITAVVNLCDDDEDDIIFVDTPSSTDFAQTFAATRLEPLSDCMSSVKLEEKTVIDTVDLTAEDESLSCKTSINQVHDKWLNDFQNSAKQYRESQLLLEKQNTQLVSNNEKQTVICLDSDSEEELVEVSTVAEKEILTVETNKENSIEDGGNKKKSQEELFVGNYPLSNLSVNSDSELDADDENDDTKISAKFMPSNLRTYQAKKPNFKSDEKNNFGANQPYTLQETNKIFRRDSVHISSTPPDEEDEEDAGTDVQDENDDNDPKDDEHQPYTFLPKANKIPDVKPMGPYPTYNSVHNDKVVFSQSVPSYSLQSVMKQYDNSSQLKSVLSNSQQQQHCPDKQDKSSDNYSEIKVPKKQKKVVRFNTNIEGPTLHQTRYKVSDAPDFYHSRGCRRFSRSSSIDSVSTTSSTKQQDHLDAFAVLFRKRSYPAPISPSLSSVSSRALGSPTKQPSTQRIKTKDLPTSIVENPEVLIAGHQSAGVPGTSNNEEPVDKCSVLPGMNERYINDPKLSKRCVVVITPSEEILQYERKQIQMYNEILKKQRKELERRTLEKQREKEQKRASRQAEIKEQIISNKVTTPVTNDKSVNYTRRTRNYKISMSCESDCETQFQMRTRRSIKDLEPLKIQIEATETTTTALLSQIDAHLDNPESAQSHSFKISNKQKQKQTTTSNDGNQHSCDISTDKNNSKMRELNLLADIAQHLSPYQLDLPENNPPSEPLPITKGDAPQTANFSEVVPKEKAIVTEQIFLQSIDNLLENHNPQLDINNTQPEASSCYAHEPKLTKAAIFKTSPCTNNSSQNEIQNNTQLEEENNSVQEEAQQPETLETETAVSLEQIIEESISVLTAAAARPHNSFNEKVVFQKDSATIPIIISNVESLNQFAQNDELGKQQKSKVNVHLLDNENLVSRKNEETLNTKDVIEEDNIINKSNNDLSSHISNDVEISVTREAEVEPSEGHFSQTLNVSPITAADLSNISMESEMSKNLPEEAEPSPVVTDMSDNSNEANVSNSFNDNILNTNNNCAAPSTEQTNEIVLPDFSVVMPTINHSSTNITTISQQDSIENNFNQFNSTLNTPLKEATDTASKETTDLSHLLKFSVQTELENTSIPIKNGLEPEAVTKFLDLILNKTVTDAESETCDKIIKELNALTTEVAVVLPNTDIIETECDSEKPDETNSSTENNKSDKEIDLKENSSTDSSKLEKSSENNSLDVKIDESEALKEPQLQTPSANIDINPPKPNLKDGRREILEDMKSAELSDISLSQSNKLRRLPIKQTFNTKCRVRLKRLNLNDHVSLTQIKSSPAPVPIAKPDELQNSNINLTKCDTKTETTLKIKKPCLKTTKKVTTDTTTATEVTPNKKPKYESEKSLPTDANSTPINQILDLSTTAQSSKATDTLIKNTTTTTIKPKTKTTKTVTFDLSNLTEEHRDNTNSSYRQKTKNHAAGIGSFLKTSRSSRKLPDNTLRAAETLQMFVNTINASTRTAPAAEFNKKRNPIKNKCIAEDETLRPPTASTLMGTPPCKKTCSEKSRSHLTSKCKDQLVSSLAPSAIPSISSDITTARIYTSSPLDQTLPEYDDNVDAVADSELILPSATGSLRRKLKRPKKSLTRPEPTDDASTDDISNQPDCNVEDDADAVVDNEDDVFAQELLPIPAANEHILEDIVSAARPTHIGTSTGIRDDYMNIEATATVPVYLFNDESRDLGSPDVNQSSDYTNVVDSSSYLNTATNTSAAPSSNLLPASANTNATLGTNLEKSMLSPSEHEVSSTQETFYQTPTKNKQTEIFDEKSSTSKEKVINNTVLTGNTSLKQKSSEDNKLKKTTEDYQTSSVVGLLQNNQVDTTNHSPEMCTAALMSTTTTTTTTSLSNNRKIRKASTHDEILFNELQQQLPSSKRKSNSTTATFCVESTSDNSNNKTTKAQTKNLDEVKSNRSLAKVDDKFKHLLKEVSKIEKDQTTSKIEGELSSLGNNIGAVGTGGSSPSTTTTINEEYLSRTKRKKLKSSKSKKSKIRSERSSKISLKPSKLTPQIPANPLIITIPKSRLIMPPTPLPTPVQLQDDQQQTEFLNIPNANLFGEKVKESTTVTAAAAEITNKNHISLTKKELSSTTPAVNKKSTLTSCEHPKVAETVKGSEVTRNTNRNPSTSKQNYASNSQTIKNKEKLKITHGAGSISNTTCTKGSNNLIFVKDKYDLIKSKDKHYHHRNPNSAHDHKEKSKEKTNAPLKSLSSDIFRSSSKGSIKEKVNKEDKSREKLKKTLEKSSTQSDNILKITIFKSSSSSSSSGGLPPSNAPFLSSNNNKQGNGKSNKNNSSLSALSSSIKMNSSAATATGSSQTTATTLSTNNKYFSS